MESITKLRKKEITNKGITLMALVITIIVLLILAGVSIATLTGQNGVLTKASIAQKETEIENAKEQAEIDIAAWIAGKLERGEKAELDDSIVKSIITGKDYVSTKEGQPGDTSFKTRENGYEVPYSDLYDKTTGNKPSLPTNENTKPYLPDNNTTVISNNAETGIIIKDSKKNEWVWVEVPKSIYTNTEYNEGTAPSSLEDYTKIESVMQAYASDYRKNTDFTDTWYSKEQHGLEEQQYNELKQSMLKSVYENGGFYIGRYEVGTDTPRAAKTDSLTTPVIQRDKYPYNYVTCSQAQERAGQLKVGNKTSSLMFGIQWDLVLKFMEEKGKLQEGTKVIASMLNGASRTWGNYSDVSFDVKRSQALYTTSPDERDSWNIVDNYTKPSSAVLLTAGATDRNSVLGIYDLAGNAMEWTLEYTANTDFPCTGRGGNYLCDGRFPASCRGQRR